MSVILMRIYWEVSAKNTVTCLKKQHSTYFILFKDVSHKKDIDDFVAK